jgi:hydrogenase/urease accessory protein HupE
MNTNYQPQLRKFISACCLLFAACFLLAVQAQAHDPGLSAAELKIEASSLAAHLTFAQGEIEALIPMDADGNGQITPEELGAAQPRLEALALKMLEIQIAQRSLLAQAARVQLDESQAIHFYLRFSRASGAQLNVRSAIITRLARGHRQYLTIRDAQGNTLAERMLDASSSAFEWRFVEAGSTAWPQSFLQFLLLGVEHILTGFDHLAFLLALLLAGGSFRAAVRIITSFTLAHSITLALATLNVLQLSPKIAEPLIAVSIVYVGLENVLRREAPRRWLLAFAFGLIHGFGFATALGELGIGSGGSGVVAPLFSFNLGVELGQVAMAALALPLIWKLRQQPLFAARYAPACSWLITLAGGYWLLERTVLK